MSSIFGGNEVAERLGIKGQGAAGQEAEIPEPSHAIVIASTLNRIERELRRIRSFTPQYGRQFVRYDGGGAPGGAQAIVFEGPKSGADWYVERVSVSVAGASAAGTVQLYEGDKIDESRWIDGLGALTGNTPSRGALDGRGTPYFIYGGFPMLVQVAGVVAGSQVLVRMMGREVLSGVDPAMREQDINIPPMP